MAEILATTPGLILLANRHSTSPDLSSSCKERVPSGSSSTASIHVRASASRRGSYLALALSARSRSSPYSTEPSSAARDSYVTYSPGIMRRWPRIGFALGMLVKEERPFTFMRESERVRFSFSHVL
eukprot:scaffold9555_cov123-Isochrysis_galbana.AAC.10